MQESVPNGVRSLALKLGKRGYSSIQCIFILLK